ncbi:response regulator [Ideonella azotifigens]|uniref:Response regulatory domain-containing protein n=1 Tax=Ideonella azotifigens TaxID=513160 RepID=A0ABN1JHR4_9BURK|nr:response regulator [Ideonella azotifigens]MCD2343578.1 response regulator [Ideonella azotifigens]
MSTMSQAPQGPDTPEAQPATGGPHVLIVDDGLDAAELLGELLAFEGYQPHLAHLAADGLALAQAMPMAVALIDLSLPDQPGSELARELRARATAAQPAPLLIAVSGHDRLGPYAAQIEACFDHFLQKPVDIDALLALLPPPGRAGE